MIRKRLEILKADTWFELELYDGEGIKYNSIINQIASTSDRSLSHSNTFEIPWTKNNIKALDLNVFNATQLAKSLNEKYEAKYYVDERLLQEGFVVINNMNNGIPSLNFIDGALTLVEKWGDTTYKEFLEDDSLLSNVDQKYRDRIDDMRTYDMTKSNVLTNLQNISGETYPIAYFPNTINCIGDKFQVDANDNRFDDHFNPFQSRPIFNAMAFLDMITQAYGYTLVKHGSVDWTTMEKTAIAAKGLKQGEIEDATSSGNYPSVSFTNHHWGTYSDIDGGTWQSQVGMEFPLGAGITPNSISMPTSTSYVHRLNYPNSGWYNNRKIFVPDTTGGFVGTINFYASDSPSNSGGVDVVIIWEDLTSPGDFLFQDATIETNNSTTEIVDVTINKSQFNTPPANAGSLVGLYLLRQDFNNEGYSGMGGMSVTEEILGAGVVTYDDYGQFEQNTVDLTYATPQKTIKDILNGILQRFGALVDIDHKAKEVEIFTYKAYGTRKTSGDFESWTEYFQQYDPPNFNTNYGNNYAVKNKIGLGNPYLGNSVERYLGNQVTKSKLKEFATDFNTQFQDITGLVVVNNTINPYDEFSIGGGTMVEFSSSLGAMTQRTWVNNTQGSLSGVANLVNVNYSQIPDGQNDWYTLIDESVRCSPSFLVPQSVIKNLDIKKPIYIDQLGGYYIIEKIDGYEDEVTPVTVDLIKLPSDWI